MKNSNLFKNILVLLLVNFFVFNGIVFSQIDNAKKFMGKWNGKLNLGSVSLRLIINIEEKDGKLTAKMDSPDQNVSDILIDEVIINENNIKVVVKSIMGSYEGKYNPEKNLIEGNWVQQGQSFPLELKKEVSSAQKTDEEKKYTSLWEGTVKFGSVSLRMVLKLFKNEDGSTGARLDSPDQNVKNIPVDKVEFIGDSIKFFVKSVGGKYAGAMEKDSPIVKGTWTQGGMAVPLELKKVDKITEAKRPQTPKKPFPYNEEEITFENNSAKITLAGTLTYPKSGGNFPAVVLVTGSGPQDRDETIFGHKPFLVIADYFTRNGIAVLRFDDRGIAKSKGSFATATTEDFASDALAAVEYLKSRKEIDSKKIGIAGHSEGGMIAPMAAVNSGDVGFIILLAGPGLRGDELLVKQTELVMKSEGSPKEKIEQQVSQNSKCYKIVIDASDSAEAYIGLKKFFDDELSKLRNEEKQKPENSVASFNQSVKTLLNPWFRFFLKFDPRPNLEQVNVPVLALNGGNDVQVPPKEDLSEIEKALKTGGNKNFKTIELPGLNHLFQHCKTCSVSEYGQLEETFSEDALKIMKDWILEVTK